MAKEKMYSGMLDVLDLGCWISWMLDFGPRIWRGRLLDFGCGPGTHISTHSHPIRSQILTFENWLSHFHTSTFPPFSNYQIIKLSNWFSYSHTRFPFITYILNSILSFSVCTSLITNLIKSKTLKLFVRPDALMLPINRTIFPFR